MSNISRPARGFPTARIEHCGGGLPDEVSLVAQHGHGAGDDLFRQTGKRPGRDRKRRTTDAVRQAPVGRRRDRNEARPRG